MAHELQRTFRDRDELIAYLAAAFPDAAAVSPLVPYTRGGRAAVESALGHMAPQPYAASRNFLAGAVTRLSAYLRHGVLSLAEVRDAALRAVEHPAEVEAAAMRLTGAK